MNLFLTKEALYLTELRGRLIHLIDKRLHKVDDGDAGKKMERETRFELATSSLEGWSSSN